MIRILAVFLLAAALLSALAACETVKETFKTDDTPAPDRVATIPVWDPFNQAELPVTVVIPRYANVELEQAVKHVQNEDFDTALTSLDAAIVRDGGDEDAYLLRGLVHEYKGNWDSAIDDFKQSNIIETNQLAIDGRKRAEAKKAE